MNRPALSILIPSLPSRLARFGIPLFEKLQAQAEDLPVEILMLTDNKARSVGHKRNALLGAARGDYVAFCDDDDDVAGDYVPAIFAKTGEAADVITFHQDAVVNGAAAEVIFRASHDRDEPFAPGAIIKRRPWHVCAWRRELVAGCIFTDKMWGEDADWVNQACAILRNGVHIPRVLHRYSWRADVSEAPAGFDTARLGE